ncbi:hypothetical protein [Dyadobacter psychrotolerans]|uniref:Uncharacterized protein n=1 Tax=Dyadobacter psychrotolerans TaxID=2541721 RepID=A0A4R5DT29_9BACT|nr:hypothetical protein [Dyadobacter psychrotolerans]TDE17539.1 hypothetical protein E0F88_06515 [Dyadobacter psychrotolerans]
MDKNIQIPGKYIVRYQSAPVVPAPFSHYYTLTLNILSETELDVDFSISYTDRDEIDEDEILDEGFTLDDDYKWKGSVPAIWTKEFQNIFASSKIIRQREEKEFEDFIEIELEENEKDVTVYPVDKERWSYFLQEFMQAIFESGGREKPFELTYLNISEGTSKLVELKASFANKSFTVVKDGNAPESLNWTQLQKVMDTVYKAEFIEDNASEKKPSKNGSYITAGDGLWYQLGIAVVEPSAKSKELAKIESLFGSLSKG